MCHWYKKWYIKCSPGTRLKVILQGDFMTKLPFSLTTRKDSPYYYVRLRNENTGDFMPWRSTGETNYNRALRKAWDIYNGVSDKLDTMSFYDMVRKASYTKEDVQLFLDDFIRKGFLSSYVLNDSTAGNLPAFSWLMDFWDFSKSDYLSEKVRKGQTIHKKHAMNSQGFLVNYWEDLIKDKKLGELTRKDVEIMFKKLDKMQLSGNTKNHVLRAFLTPMKWAYNNELVSKDLSKGWTMYSTDYNKRLILPMETVSAVFAVEWESDVAKLASMLSMCTGMRCGEIQALTCESLGEDFIDVTHSWSEKDGLKCTKNGEDRRVYIPFSGIMDALRALGERNPYSSQVRFIFWGLVPDKPLDGKLFLRYLRRALVLTGLTEKEAEGYTFHSWRHFYTTYMADRLNAKVLQSQTGHKTRAMLDHYSDHQTREEAKQIVKAQLDLFGKIVS